MKRWSEEKYRKVKLVTKMLSVLLCVLLVSLVFPGLFLIMHMKCWRYFYAIITSVLSVLFSSSWIILVIGSFDRLRNRSGDLLSSRNTAVVLIILGIILALIGLGLSTGSIILLIISE